MASCPKCGNSEKTAALLLGSFASVALLISLVGLYSLVSQTTVRRIPEFGLRAALGANRRQLWTLIAGETARLLSVGLALGGAGAVAFAGSLRHSLYGVGAFEPLTLFAVAVQIVVVCALATALPTLRALRVPLDRALKLRD